GETLGYRSTAHDDDARGLHLADHASHGPEQLRDLESQDCRARDLGNVGKPDTAVLELWHAAARRPPAVGERSRKVGQALGVELVDVLVVGAHLGLSGQRRTVDQLARRQHGHLTVRGQTRAHLTDGTAMTAHEARVRRADPRPTEFADRARGLRDEEDAIHGRCTRAGTPTTVVPGATSAVTTAPAATTAPLPIVTLGKTTAPAPTKAPGSTVTSPEKMTPGDTYA